MDEQMKTEVLELLQKAQDQIKLGDLSSAKAYLEQAKDKIDRPIGGGTLGPDKGDKK